MPITIGPITLDADVAATRHFYETGTGFVPCTCAGCRNFLLAAQHMPSALLDALCQLGIDPAKPAEQWVNAATPDGKAALYGGFYHVCGTIEGEPDAFRTEDFTLTASSACSLLAEDFPAPAMQLEFMCRLPWLLEMPSTEAYPSL